MDEMSFSIGVGLDASTSMATVLLASLGLYVIYGQMRVINMAHGDLMMIGAYTVSIVRQWGLPFFGALACATFFVGVLGLLIETLVVSRLYRRDNLSTLLATWGVSLCLVESVRLIFGPSGRYVDPPTTTVLSLAGVPYPLYSLLLVGSTVLLLLVLYFVLHATRIGLFLRATQEDPSQAEISGINTRKVYRWTFVAGAAIAGLSGGLLAPISSVTPNMGLDYSARSFLVVITGGFAHLGAPVAGSVLVGGIHSILNSYMGVTRATIGMLIAVLIVLFSRPDGMVPER